MKPLQRQSEANQTGPSDSCDSFGPTPFDKVSSVASSAGFQPAVSPISNRQNVAILVAPSSSNHPQAGSTAIRQVGNLRYDFVPCPASTPSVDILILSDGTILVHNLTPDMAATLNAVNPQDPTIASRVLARIS